MHSDDLATRLAAPATRRSVVRTGAKLAYAAPLVAASMKLGSRSAEAAIVSGGGTLCGGAPCVGACIGTTCYPVAVGPACQRETDCDPRRACINGLCVGDTTGR